MLRESLSAGRFVVTAELTPGRDPSPGALSRRAAALAPYADAVNLPDNPGARVSIASWAGSLIALWADAEPVMQLTGRDRNRIALQSDLVSASAMGVRNVLLLTGDPPGAGDDPDAAPVFDLDGPALIRAAAGLRDRGRLLSGREVSPAPDLFIGAAEDPFAGPPEVRAERLAVKAEAGADFVQTQFVFDVRAFEAWMSAVRARGLHERCAVLAGVGPLGSPRALRFLAEELPGVRIPDAVVRRLGSVPEHRFAEEARRLAAETIAALRATPGVAGVHLMTMGRESEIPELLERAGLTPEVNRRAG
ncbi:MAG: methylenetetrahydrofolate reductase [Streptosporangiales bacterium]|nr:methylenetetrahydrofolate reductase [Streptosporangiales bacterium]